MIRRPPRSTRTGHTLSLHDALPICIIWHTQGSGKSLTMVWLAKWLREHQPDARVLLVTDRTELDEQIEGVFNGVNEEIYRTSSGTDLLSALNQSTPWLICSLIHKFRGSDDEVDQDEADTEFISELKAKLPANFQAKGNLFVFVDEAHRTQSGKMHEAMKLQTGRESWREGVGKN